MPKRQLKIELSYIAQNERTEEGLTSSIFEILDECIVTEQWNSTTSLLTLRGSFDDEEIQTFIQAVQKADLVIEQVGATGNYFIRTSIIEVPHTLPGVVKSLTTATPIVFHDYSS